MKKFFSKLSVMVVLLVLSVALLGTYIGLLARPVAYGMNYSYTMHKEDCLEDSSYVAVKPFADLFKTFDITTNVRFENGKKLVMSVELSYKFEKDADAQQKAIVEPILEGLQKGMEGETVEAYFSVGNKVYIIEDDELTGDEYKAAVEDYKKLPDWEKSNILTVNAFNCKLADEETTDAYVCNGTIVIAVVLGVVEAALITFSTLSVLWFVKSRKSK